MICQECKREFPRRTGSYCGSCQPLRPTVDSVKQRVSLLLSGAVAGTIPDYRIEDGAIRWGRVERDVHAAIDVLANALLGFIGEAQNANRGTIHAENAGRK